MPTALRLAKFGKRTVAPLSCCQSDSLARSRKAGAKRLGLANPFHRDAGGQRRTHPAPDFLVRYVRMMLLDERARQANIRRHDGSVGKQVSGQRSLGDHADVFAMRNQVIGSQCAHSAGAGSDRQGFERRMGFQRLHKQHHCKSAGRDMTDNVIRPRLFREKQDFARTADGSVRGHERHPIQFRNCEKKKAPWSAHAAGDGDLRVQITASARKPSE
jgi:hypothetical protein